MLALTPPLYKPQNTARGTARAIPSGIINTRPRNQAKIKVGLRNQSLVVRKWLAKALNAIKGSLMATIIAIETAERTFSSKFSQLTKNKYPFNPLIKVENKINPGTHFPNTKELNENLEFIFLDNAIFLKLKDCKTKFSVITIV